MAIGGLRASNYTCRDHEASTSLSVPEDNVILEEGIDPAIGEPLTLHLAILDEAVGSSMKDAVRLGTWVATDGGIPQDRIGLNSRDYKSDTADQGHDHKMAET